MPSESTYNTTIDHTMCKSNNTHIPHLILQVINTLHAALGHDLEADHVFPRAERVLDAADEVVGLQHQQRLPVHRLQALGHVV